MDKTFDQRELKELYQPLDDARKNQNGQVTIIGGASLFHGAPLLALITASRIVDMVFFSSPEPSVGSVAEKIKSKLFSFIWVPWGETDEYVKKSDAVLIGPGLMRFKDEAAAARQRVKQDDPVGRETREITKKFLKNFPDKKWVIDAGSLQVMDKEWIPEGAILTPNRKEYDALFGKERIEVASQKFKCTILLKGVVDRVCSRGEGVEIAGGNPGMTKGGTGDVLAGLAVSLYAKNDAFLSSTAASYITKKAGDTLFKEVGPFFNADDLAAQIPRTSRSLRK